jgi:outer membrane protein assembly factor BamB
MFARCVAATLFLAALAGCGGSPSPDASSAGGSAGTPATGGAARGTAAAGEEVPGDWPKWRGPAGNGVSSETEWNAEWSSNGPQQLWTAEVGTGFSSMSVMDGRLYTMGHEGENDTIWCLNAETGKVIWTSSYPCKLVNNLHEGGPACTPTLDGAFVYTVSKEGQLFCLNRVSGELQWKQELTPLLDVPMPAWGFSCSPLPWGRMVIVEAGRTVAFDRETGQVLWQTEKYLPGYGSPARFMPGGQDLIAVLNNDDLLLLQPDDGSEVAKFPWVTNFATNATTPVVWEDTIFISSGYDHGCALVKFADGKLEEMWQNKSLKNHMANSVLWQGHIYGFDGNSNLGRAVELVCLDYATGKEKWKERGLGCGSLLIAGGRLIVLSDAGDLVTAPALPAGFQTISRAAVIEGRCWTVPVLSHGRIYCRNAAGHLVALDVRRNS